MRTRLPVAGEKQKSGFFDSSVSRNGTRGENEIGVDCVYSQIRRETINTHEIQSTHFMRGAQKTRVIIRVSCESRTCACILPVLLSLAEMKDFPQSKVRGTLKKHVFV